MLWILVAGSLLFHTISSVLLHPNHRFISQHPRPTRSRPSIDPKLAVSAAVQKTSLKQPSTISHHRFIDTAVTTSATISFSSSSSSDLHHLRYPATISCSIASISHHSPPLSDLSLVTSAVSEMQSPLRIDSFDYSTCRFYLLLPHVRHLLGSIRFKYRDACLYIDALDNYASPYHHRSSQSFLSKFFHDHNKNSDLNVRVRNVGRELLEAVKEISRVSLGQVCLELVPKENGVRAYYMNLGFQPRPPPHSNRLILKYA